MAEMRHSLVAYLEILIPAGEPGGTVSALLSELIHALFAPRKDLPLTHERSVLQLGNQLVLVCPWTSQFAPNPIWPPLFMVLELTDLQSRLSRQGIFFRGAVANGEVWVHGRAIVGPGILAAQEQARPERVPRIVMDPGLLQAMAQDPLLQSHYPQENLAYIKSLLTQDSDGFWFVDYPVYGGLLAAQEHADWLHEHARQIEDALARIRTHGEDARGWLWLATQHDRAVDRLEGIDEGTRAALRVTSDTLLRFHF